MRNGTALDAVLISLGANAEHGKRREAGDYRKAYDIACHYKLVPPTDSDAVAKLLRCSIQWARNLTAEARERERAAEDAAIRRGLEEGKTMREIADEIGRSPGTVHGRVQKGKPFENEQADEPDPYADFRVSQSPTGQRWHRALEALRAINAQADVSAMFADRYRGVDHAIEPA